MLDNKNVESAELRQRLLEDADILGGWMGDDYSVQFYADKRDVDGAELTMLLRDSDGKEELVYIILMPSVEPRHYDAWMRKTGEQNMRLLLHCKAADLYEMHHQLMLRLPELQMI